MAESKKESPDTNKVESAKVTVETKAGNKPGRTVSAIVGGAVEEALKEDQKQLGLQAENVLINRRIGEHDQALAKVKEELADKRANKKYPTDPNTIEMPSHQGERPREVQMVNKVVATDKEVEESKKNRKVMEDSSPFNPKNITTVVKVG